MVVRERGNAGSDLFSNISQAGMKNMLALHYYKFGLRDSNNNS